MPERAPNVYFIQHGPTTATHVDPPTASFRLRRQARLATQSVESRTQELSAAHGGEAGALLLDIISADAAALLSRTPSHNNQRDQVSVAVITQQSTRPSQRG
eukprot:3257072-Rhodomonas_salina.1